MQFVLIVALGQSGIEVVGAVVVDVPCEGFPHITTRLGMNFVGRVLGDVHRRVQFQGPGAGGVRGGQFLQIRIGVGVQEGLKVLVHEIMHPHAGVGLGANQRVVRHQFQNSAQRNVVPRIEAMGR